MLASLRRLVPAALAATVLLAACSTDHSTPKGLPDPCAVVTSADFQASGISVEAPRDPYDVDGGRRCTYGLPASLREIDVTILGGENAGRDAFRSALRLVPREDQVTGIADGAYVDPRGHGVHVLVGGRQLAIRTDADDIDTLKLVAVARTATARVR
jgi:hypothetical protein